jgi:hypothetical protein
VELWDHQGKGHWELPKSSVACGRTTPWVRMKNKAALTGLTLASTHFLHMWIRWPWTAHAPHYPPARANVNPLWKNMASSQATNHPHRQRSGTWSEITIHIRQQETIAKTMRNNSGKTHMMELQNHHDWYVQRIKCRIVNLKKNQKHIILRSEKILYLKSRKKFNDALQR